MDFYAAINLAMNRIEWKANRPSRGLLTSVRGLRRIQYYTIKNNMSSDARLSTRPQKSSGSCGGKATLARGRPEAEKAAEKT